MNIFVPIYAHSLHLKVNYLYRKRSGVDGKKYANKQADPLQRHAHVKENLACAKVLLLHTYYFYLFITCFIYGLNLSIKSIR